MRFSIIAFSENGASLAKRISLGLKNNSKDNKTDVYIASRHAESTGFVPFSSVYDLTEGMFNDADAIIYIGACGIAVRAIAPLVKSKLRDPAVIVCDEMGRFAISLLSGHVGGANEITGEIAKIIGANPVITTASDSYNAYYNVQSPKNLVLGIGCRKGLKPEDIERAVTIMLWDEKIPLSRVVCAATIDVKKNDIGLLGFATAHKLEIDFYTSAQLNGVIGKFSSSQRVLDRVGVDNVCERAAVLRGEKGRLIMGKKALNGVTTAVFEKE